MDPGNFLEPVGSIQDSSTFTTVTLKVLVSNTKFVRAVGLVPAVAEARNFFTDQVTIRYSRAARLSQLPKWHHRH